MAREPLCRACAMQGIVKRADELDHIVRRADAPELLMDESNVQPLCRECHEKKTADENKSKYKKWGCDIDGSLLNSFEGDNE